MKVYTGTGVTKTDELRINKGVGALILTTNQQFDKLTSERISVWIETSNNGNINIFDKVLMSHALLGLTFGESMLTEVTDPISGDSTLSALIDVSKNGSIPLKGDETIKVQLSSLDTKKTYSINAIEYPIHSNELVSSTTKIMLSDDTRRDYGVQQFDKLVLSDVSILENIEFHFSNGSRIEYSQNELLAISNDIEPYFGVNTSNGMTLVNTNKNFVISLDEVQHIEIEKQTGKLELTFFNQL